MATRFHSVPERVNVKTLRAFRRALPCWYQRCRRDLPWRRTRDPYAIWVSEIMLQQTRVEVVIDYYHRWLRAFPSVNHLARARPQRVLKQWEGLGYYRRARHLQQAARQLVRDDRHDGRLPRAYVEWLELPGIGRYTAAAIASIAFDETVPVVDGNVARVLARVFAICANVKSARTLDELWVLARQLMPRRAAGDYNQAMMELGALVCTPANPHCDDCPLQRVCRARAQGLVGQLPNRGQPLATRRVTERVALMRDGERVWVQRRPAEGLLGGLWELPPLNGARGRPLFVIEHSITHRRIRLVVVAARVPTAEGRWIRPRDLERLAFSAGQRRALQRVFSAQHPDR